MTMLSKKLYKVHIGLVDDGDDFEASNWSSKTVIAKDATDAIKRARLKKDEYPEAVTLISDIDVV
jgi:hypothetical protein